MVCLTGLDRVGEGGGDSGSDVSVSPPVVELVSLEELAGGGGSGSII